MERKNCWEVKRCDLEPGGENSIKSWVCPAALPNEYDGVNKGKYAGRFCWAVAGTLCGRKIQGIYAMKLMNCLNCEFLKQVNEDEGRDFILTPPKREI